eukprot:6161294-Pyramimonas_sp.AAC.1
MHPARPLRAAPARSAPAELPTKYVPWTCRMVLALPLRDCAERHGERSWLDCHSQERVQDLQAPGTSTRISRRRAPVPTRTMALAARAPH